MQASKSIDTCFPKGKLEKHPDITAHYSFVNFFISRQKFGHIMLHHPLKRQEKEIQVSRLTAWPVYQEMSMKYTFK